MASQTYLDFIEAVRAYLTETGSSDPKNGKSNKQVVLALRKRIDAGELDIAIGEGSMLSYLSRAANQDETSGIISGGVGIGYYLESQSTEAAEPKPSDQKKIKSKQGNPETLLERDLYPLMEKWLNSKGYMAKDTSNLKSGGDGETQTSSASIELTSLAP